MSYDFIDLFAGIGGFRLAFDGHGKCVFSSEKDKFARKAYLANHGDIPDGDITKINVRDIPAHDILLAGFPCQAFSRSGKQAGFDDSRGTMFFEIQRILASKKPRMFLLENVKQLVTHQGGDTLKLMVDILTGAHDQDIPDSINLSDDVREALGTRLNYHVECKVLKSSDFGMPQKRERLFIVGFNKDYYPEIDFKWPEPCFTPTRIGDYLEIDPDSKYTLSDKFWDFHQKRREINKAAGRGFDYSLYNGDSPFVNTITASYAKDGRCVLIEQPGMNPRRLTPRECARVQGYDDSFILDAVSEFQAYKQIGNSVPVPVIKLISNAMMCVKGKGRVVQQRLI